MKLILSLLVGFLLLSVELPAQSKKRSSDPQENIIRVDSPVKVILTQPQSNTIRIEDGSTISLKQPEKTNFEKIQPYLGFIGVFIGFLLGWGLTTWTRKKDRTNQIFDRDQDRSQSLLDKRIDENRALIESLRHTLENQIPIIFKMRRLVNETLHHNFNWRFLELELKTYPDIKAKCRPLIDSQIQEYNSKKGQFQDLVGDVASLFQRFNYFLTPENKEKYKKLLVDMFEFNLDVFAYIPNNADEKDLEMYRVDGAAIDALHVNRFLIEVLRPIQDLQREVMRELEAKVIS